MMSPLFALAFATSVASAGQAQQPSWIRTVSIRTEVTYNDNAFLLPTGRLPRLDTGSWIDSVNGRFKDMDSAQDLVLRTNLALGLEGPGLGGRTLALTADLAYEANLQNERRRHADLGVRIAQSLGSGGRLRFNLDARPSYYHKNYFSGARQLDGNAATAPRERVYAAGISHEVDVAAAYRRRLLRSAGVTLLAELELGYFHRVYDAPFKGRSRRGPGAGVDLTLELGRRWTLGLDVAYQALAADVSNETILFAERQFGVDYNGDLDLQDDFVRTVDNDGNPLSVDRSRTEREVAVSVGRELGRWAMVEVAYGRRRRSFSSEQQYDFLHRDRIDTRNDISVGLDVRLTSGVHFLVDVRHAAQTTNRAGDPAADGEDADYTQNVVSAGLRYRLR